MSLHKIRDFYPNYREQFEDQDILKFGLYSGDDKVGSVDDLLVDEEGKFRYLVINTGAWIFGKKVLLPIGRAHIDYNNQQVYVNGLTREQVENLPEYDENMTVDYDYEERVRGVYRPMGSASYTPALNTNAASLDMAPSLDTNVGIYDRPNYERETYGYQYEPALYDLNERNHQNLKLYEERLIANKSRQKVGDVTVGKRVETETQHISIPIEKEQIVIERVNSTDMSTTVTPGADAFSEGEVVRMEVYEETPDIQKETFVREEVRVKKEVEQTTVEAEDTIRKEQLDIDKQGDFSVRDAERRGANRV